jgi:hypothetical protein
MEQKSAQELRAFAKITTEAPPPLDRRARLERWADILDLDPHRKINLVRELEFATRAAQRQMREDDSALAVAYADPLLRAQGLASDRVGDGQEFFGLSDAQTHRLLCSCMHGLSMKAGDAAGLIRAIANPAPKLIRQGVVVSALCALPLALFFFG